jgi:hypothetical protein
MKKSVILVAFILMALGISSCSSDTADDNLQNSEASVQAITNLAVSGTWSISSFVDSGTDETNNFNGYGFTFNSDGSLLAENGLETITGTWSVTSDDSSDDSDDYDSSDDIDFNLFFSAPPDFAELSEDWDIVSRSASRIELIHVSGGNGGTDTLTFVMN